MKTGDRKTPTRWTPKPQPTPVTDMDEVSLQPRRTTMMATFTLAVATVCLPLLLAGVVGAAIDRTADTEITVTGLDVFGHNLRLGLIIAALGFVTVGAASSLVVAIGSVASGYAIGAHIGSAGWAATAVQLPHFFPEMAAFVAFAAAGLHGGSWVLDVFWGSTTRAALERAVPRYAVLNAASGLLLAIAGAFEATVL